MQKRDVLGYLALLFMALATLIATYYFGFAPHYFRVAVPPANSEASQLFSAMSVALRREHSRVRLTVQPYEANEDIVRALETGKADLAIVRTDRPLPRASLGVAQVQEMFTLVLARPGVGIETFADLKGRRVGELTRSAPGTGVFAELMSFNRMKPGDISIESIKYPAAIAAALESSKFDALLLVAPRGARPIAEAVRTLTAAFEAPPAVIALKEAKAIATRIPAIDAGEIAAGELSVTPQLPDTAIPTLTFPSLLVANQKLDNASVQDLTRELFNVRNSLTAKYPAAAHLAALDTERGANFAVHPGAAIYYDASEASFLDRYSDMLWLLLFGFSTIVSAFVWFIRRLFPQQREMMRADHTELLELLKTARTTQDAATLNAVETRIDEIVAEISRMSFDGKIDGEQMPAFDVIIERIEKIIESRRELLRA